MRIIIGCYFVTLILFSCNDFLEPGAVSFLNSSSFYSNEKEIELAVNGVYSQLQVLYHTSGTNFWAMTEMRSDNTTYQYNSSNRGGFETEFLDEFLTQETDRDPEDIWRKIYTGILQCNTVISRIDNVNFEDEKLKTQFIGEIKFIRAFYYFHLARLFGDVPLILEEVNSPENAFSSERTSKELVYQQIIEDVTESANKLPSGYKGNNVGRVTKGAALTLLGEVYMTLKEFDRALNFFEQVINLDYSLVPNYSDVFEPSNKNNSESIFEIQYNATIEGEASRVAYRFVPFNSGQNIIPFNDLNPGAAGYNIPTHDIINTYEAGDLRKEASVGYFVHDNNSEFDVAIGDSIPYILKFVHQFDQPGRTDEDWPVYRFSHVLLMTAEAINEISGPTVEARNYVNMVRERAGLENISQNLGQEDFRNIIYKEQRIELAFENHRWFQLVRTGRAIDVMTEHGQKQKELISRLPPESFIIEEYKLIYPIPFREVRLNNFDQNPGW